MMEIHEKAMISRLADIEDSIRGSRLVVGQGTFIDSFVKIKFSGGTGDIVIGKHCSINSGVVIYSGNGVTIGDNVLIAANCTFSGATHEYASREKNIREQGFKKSRGGIVVGDDVWIGANCVILDGAVIPGGAVVGASCLVRGELEPYGIYVGNPVALIGHRQ